MNPYFQDTATAFDYKSDTELRKAWLLFLLMRHMPRFTVFLARLGNVALRWKLPLVRTLIKKTFFDHFCGGETLEHCGPTIQRLSAYQVDTALDIGVEAQNTEDAWVEMTRRIVEAILYASHHEAVPVISLKVTAIASFDLLEKYSSREALTAAEEHAWAQVKERLDLICSVARRAKRKLYIDAEESWIQPALDNLVMEMMVRYNEAEAVVYNTYQLYLTSSLGRLKTHYHMCEQNQSFFAAKLVRGAYLEKENQRAARMGVTSPVQPSKDATDDAYDTAAAFCLDHHKQAYLCLATHNEKSHEKAIRKMEGLDLDTTHVHFCQLFGMSDHITFELARRHYTALKYLPFGKLEETFPYLIRRAEENTSVTRDASRELQRIQQELKRRKVKA